MPIAPKPNAPSPSRARHKGRASAGDDPPSGQDTRRPRLCSPTPLAPIALGSKLIGLGNTATQLLGAWSRAHLAEQEIGVRSTRFRSPTPTAISVSGPAIHVTIDSADHIVPLLTRVAKELSTEFATDATDATDASLSPDRSPVGADQYLVSASGALGGTGQLDAARTTLK